MGLCVAHKGQGQLKIPFRSVTSTCIEVYYNFAQKFFIVRGSVAHNAFSQLKRQSHTHRTAENP